MRREEFVRRLYFALHPTIVLAQPTEIPKVLVERIREERLLELAKQLNGEEVEEACDAEVVAFLHSASLVAPLSPEFANIFVVLTQKLFGARVDELDRLTEQEEHELKKLKRWLYRTRERNERKIARKLRDAFREVAKHLPKEIVVERLQTEAKGRSWSEAQGRRKR